MALRRPVELDLTVPSSDALVVQLTPMRHKHLRSVVRIEQEVYPKPWTTALFRSELVLRINRCYTVATVSDLVVGYSGVSFLEYEAHVTNIAVDPVWQRQRIATRLMVRNLRLALERSVRDVTLEVRVSNLAAQRMYHHFGFRPGGIRPRYYENNEDALIMWANDIDSAAYESRLCEIEQSLEQRRVAEVHQ